MAITSIALVNRSTVLTPADVARGAAAIDLQVRRDFGPAWGKYAAVWAAGTERVGSDTWKVYLWDAPRTTADAGTYGHHELVDGTMVPTAHVFAKTAEADGEAWTSIASHEVLEMLADEWVNLVVTRQRGASMELWPREVCDAVQGEAYAVGGCKVANFVLPAYFCEGSRGPYDFLRRLDAPFAIGPGGYSSVMKLTPQGHPAWHDVYGVNAAAWRRSPHPASRRAHRKGSDT